MTVRGPAEPLGTDEIQHHPWSVAWMGQECIVTLRPFQGDRLSGTRIKIPLKSVLLLFGP